MSKDNGYILLYRKICDSFLWDDKPFSKGQAWIDLILLANHTEKDKLIKGVVVHIKRGQLVRSRQFLAERWGWNVKSVDRFIKTLKNQKMVDYKGTPQGTLITIDKYGIYQPARDTKRTPKGTAQGTAEGTQTNNVNKCKRNSVDNHKRLSTESEKHEKAVSQYADRNDAWD